MSLFCACPDHPVPLARGRSPGKRAVEPMSARGGSTSWKNAQEAHVKHGDSFLKWVADNDDELSARWGPSWAEVPEAEAC